MIRASLKGYFRGYDSPNSAYSRSTDRSHAKPNPKHANANRDRNLKSNKPKPPKLPDSHPTVISFVPNPNPNLEQCQMPTDDEGARSEENKSDLEFAATEKTTSSAVERQAVIDQNL